MSENRELAELIGLTAATGAGGWAVWRWGPKLLAWLIRMALLEAGTAEQRQERLDALTDKVLDRADRRFELMSRDLDRANAHAEDAQREAAEAKAACALSDRKHAECEANLTRARGDHDELARRFEALVAQPLSLPPYRPDGETP